MTTPACAHDAARVEVFPKGPVPANLLRWHLRFDRPAIDIAQDAVVLLDATGQPVREAFVDLPEGLWDDRGTGLTLLHHPGRIKSGLRSAKRFGGALRQGQGMRLRIDLARLFGPRSGAGTVEHSFAVNPAETSAIDVARWHIGPVEPGSRHPAWIGFDRSMDWLSVQQALAVADANGVVVPGRLWVLADGRSARFEPNDAWAGGPHHLLAATDLEDVSGNRPGVAFESSGRWSS
jgi:hypothetical protein